MLPTEIATRRASALPTLGDGPVRAVLDTNTLLDWLVFGDEAAQAVGSAVSLGRLQWMTTPRMLTELRTVLARPLPRRWESARELALTIDLTNLVMVCAEPTPPQRLVCRDRADQVFIDLAVQLSPALLLTRDRALLALRRRAANWGVEITTAASWRLHADGPH